MPSLFAHRMPNSILLDPDINEAVHLDTAFFTFSLTLSLTKERLKLLVFQGLTTAKGSLDLDQRVLGIVKLKVLARQASFSHRLLSLFRIV